MLSGGGIVAAKRHESSFRPKMPEEKKPEARADRVATTHPTDAIAALLLTPTERTAAVEGAAMW